MKQRSSQTADQEWVNRIFAGDATAWNRFVESFTDRVWRRSWHLCNESCPHNKAAVACVFHSLVRDSVAPASEQRPGCDDGLEIYAFIFDYLYNRTKNTGKLKHFDGRASLESFVAASMHSNLRTDWIRHKRKLRVDQITRPEEIQRLSEADGRVFEQMVMQRPTETISRKLGMAYDDVQLAQERVTHALMTNGNLHLILRSPEGSIDDQDWVQPDTAPRILPMKRAVDDMWGLICELITRLPEDQKILLDMVFDKELSAQEILDRVTRLGISLPVTPRSGKVTIHSIYQSIDAILKTLGEWMSTEHEDTLRQAYDWLEDDSLSTAVSVKGLKALLKNMGLGSARSDDDRDAPGATPGFTAEAT